MQSNILFFNKVNIQLTILSSFNESLISIYFFCIFLFVFGICGIFYSSKNLLLILLYIEVSFVGLFGLFLTTSLFLNNPLGQIFAIILLILIACESVIGLGILLILYKTENSISIKKIERLRG